MWCAGINCTNNRKKTPQHSFYRFPRDKARSAKWVQATKRVDLQSKSVDYLYKNCRICSGHFEGTQFLQDGSLVWNAIPSIFDVPNPPRRRPEKRCKQGAVCSIQDTERSVNGHQVELADHDYTIIHSVSKLSTEKATQTQPVIPHASSRTVDATQNCNLIKSTDRVKIYRLKKKVRLLKENSKNMKNKSGSVKNIVKDAAEFLDEPALHFFASQLRIGKRRLKGRRYTSDDKRLAFDLNRQSPAAYRFCRKTKLFALPSDRSLRRWVEKVQPGLNDTSFEILKQKAKIHV